MASKTPMILVVAVLLLGAPVAMGRHEDNADANKNRPVTKVVNLLKDMQKQLEEEAEQDEEIYDKMACWCTTNDKEKTQAVADAEDLLSRLTAEIEAQTATSSRLDQEITNLDAEVKENQAALDKAKAIREKELAEFRDEEKEAIEAIRALKSAIVVLSKHHKGASMVQTSELSKIVAMMRTQMTKHADLLAGVITPSQRRLLNSDRASAALVQGADVAAPHLQKYKPASGEIFGILKGMKETFEANLSSSQKEEMQSASAFEQLKAAKGEEIAAATESIKTKTAELAKAKEKLAEAKQDQEDTMATLSADQKFLIELKKSCALTDSEWEERQKARNEEIAAISEAISILTSDDARDSFTKTFNFLQLRAKRHGKDGDQAKAAASAVLLRAAKASGSPKLAALASAVKLDAFKEVKDAINGLIDELKAQQADEVAHKDECVDSIHGNTMETDRKTREHEEATAKIEDSKATIQTLTEEIEALKAEIAETQLQIKRLGEDREKENAEFQHVVADQRETLEILNSAYSRLNQFYNKKASSLVQLADRRQPAGYEGPTMKELKPNSGASGVLGLLQNVIADAKRVQEDAVKDEAKAQTAYEETLKGMNESINAAEESVTQKDKAKADEEATLLEHEEWQSGVEADLETLATAKADNSKNCDFYLKNFDVRQTARAEEIAALKEAIAILSGAKNFLQKSKGL